MIANDFNINIIDFKGSFENKDIKTYTLIMRWNTFIFIFPKIERKGQMDFKYRQTYRHKNKQAIDLYTSFADKDIKPYTLIMRGNTKSSYSPRSRGRAR